MPLDVKHGRAGIRRKALDGDLIEGLLKTGRHLLPRPADRLPRISATGDGTLENRRIHRLDDLTEADLAGASGQKIASSLASPAFDQSCAA